MTECKYIENKECKKLISFDNCILCIEGQKVNELSLMNSAIANLTASIEEGLIMDRLRE